jgi:hypothetical protein
MNKSDHTVQFFGADHQLVEAVARFLHEGLLEDETCIVAMTQEHREQVESRLIDAGMDPQRLIATYRYIALDARALLASFIDERTGIDAHRFHESVGLLVRQAAARGQPVRICGEIVNLLVQEGRHATALHLEELWNELSRYQAFTLFCTYHDAALNPKFRHLLHAAHSHVLEDA